MQKDFCNNIGMTVFESIIDLSIDAAGNAWSTNNWNDLPVATGINDNPAHSTWGGGTGINVIYGVAEPVQPPRIGSTGAQVLSGSSLVGARQLLIVSFNWRVSTSNAEQFGTILP